MRLRYYSKFNDENNVTITVNIYKEGYTGEAESFLLSADPVTISYESNDIFKPIKYSGCSIKLVTPHILEDLYTGKVTDVYIEIIKEDKIIWCGYNTPNIYNQEWVTDLDATTIEGIDTLSALQYFDFTYSDKENAVSFYEVIKHSLEQTRKGIDTLIYKNLLGENDAGLLNKLHCLERNFFDESEEPMKFNEVLEHIMQFLGVTLYQWGNEYIICANDALFRDDVNIYKYNLNTSEHVVLTSSFEPKKYEVAENTSTVSYGDVFNQVNVIGNLLEIEDTTIELDDKDLEVVPNADGKYTIDLYLNDGNDKEQNRIFYRLYNKPKWGINMSFDPLRKTYVSHYICDHLNEGSAVVVREATIKPYVTMVTFDNEHYMPIIKEPTKLEFEEYISFKIGETYNVAYRIENPDVETHVSSYIPITTFPYKLNDLKKNVVFSCATDNPVSYPKQSWFILDFKFDVSKRIGRKTEFADDFLKNYPYEPSSWIPPFDSIAESYRITKNHHPEKHKTLQFNDPYDQRAIYYFGFLAKLQVGNKYFNGGAWQDEECTFAFRTESIDNFTKNTVLDLRGYYPLIDNTSAKWGTWEILNTNKYSIKTKSDKSGFLIPISQDLSGIMKFTLYDCILRPNKNGEGDFTNDATDDEADYNYINLKEFSIDYTLMDDTDIFDIPTENEDKDEDLKYSQEIDNNNVTEFEDITLYLNTYNPQLSKKLSYSYVLDENLQYLQKLSKDGTLCRPEEHIVRQYATHYGTPKIKHSNTIKSDGISPMDVVWVNSLGKYLTVGTINYNLTFNDAEVELYEI